MREIIQSIVVFFLFFFTWYWIIHFQFNFCNEKWAAKRYCLTPVTGGVLSAQNLNFYPFLPFHCQSPSLGQQHCTELFVCLSVCLLMYHQQNDRFTLCWLKEDGKTPPNSPDLKKREQDWDDFFSHKGQQSTWHGELICPVSAIKSTTFDWRNLFYIACFVVC